MASATTLKLTAMRFITGLLFYMICCVAKLIQFFRAFGGGKSAQKSQRYAGILYS
jgi:hypothetical protein